MVCLLYSAVVFCCCSAASQPNAATAKDKTDGLNVDTNHRLCRTLDRAADKPLGSPLIIRHVAGSDVKKGRLIHEPAVSTDPEMHNADRDGQQQELKDRNKMMASLKVAADAETKVEDDAKGEPEVVDLAAAGGVSAGGKFDDYAVMLDKDISQGRTTNAADRALRVAPFTLASHAISLMASEVVGGGGDSDDEAGDGNWLPTGTPATLSKSPLGSSSSAQLSSHRSVQHMLKQIQDNGERINERISSRDFGARRRLPAVPVDAVDSDIPTSSHSAKSDGSGEALLEHRPIRSVLEELHRPAIRSPKSSGKNSVSPRQLPDPSAIKHTVITNSQLSQPKPENLSNFPPGDEIGMKCNRGLLQPSSCSKHSVPDDNLPNTAMSIHDNNIPAERMPSGKLMDNKHDDVANALCGQIYTDTATKPAENETNVEIPDHCASVNSVPVDSLATYDRDLPAYSVDLVASESRPQKWPDSAHDILPVTKSVCRGTADGESPRNTVNDEPDRKSVLSECLQFPITRLSDPDDVPLCAQSSVIPGSIMTDSYSTKCTSAVCFLNEAIAQNIESVSERAFDQMCPTSPSAGARNRTDTVTDVGLKRDDSVDAEYVYRNLVDTLPTSPRRALVMSSEIAGLLRNDATKHNDSHNSVVNCDQLAAVSLPNTSCPEVNDTDAVSNAWPMFTSPSARGKNNTATTCDISFLLHNDRLVHNEVIEQNAGEKADSDNLPAAAVAKTSSNLKSDVDWLSVETGRRIQLFNELSKPPLLTAASEQNMKSSTCTVTSDNHNIIGVKDEVPFCLAGPKRALYTQNSSAVVPSISAVIKTGGQPLTALGTAMNLPGNVPAKSDQLTGVHVPVIRSTNAAQTTTVSSTAEKHLGMNQRKPGNAAVKIGHIALSRVTGLPPPIRLSTHSPQPPTEPASRPAAAATQARFVCVAF